MMPFGRTGKHNNRSQHNLVGSTVGGGANSQSQSDGVSAVSNHPPPASSNNTAFSSSESFDNPLRPSQPQPNYLPHSVNIHSTAQGGGNDTGSNNGSDFVSQLHHSNTVSGAAYDSRRREADFADQVSRTQSQRYPQQISPIQTQQQQQQLSQLQLQQQYGLGSVENLHETVAVNSPGASQQGPPSQQQQQLPSGAPPKKQSTRKLIKNILTGNNNKSSLDSPQQHQQTPQSSYNNTGGLARRPSKRVSNLPPTIPTGVSQVSLEQQPQPFDWQTRGPPITPSPLQPAEEFRNSYLFPESNRELLLQNPLDFLHTNSVRQVPAEADPSPYSPEEVGAYQQQQAEIQLQGPSPELQQHQFNQAAFDQQQQQQQQQQLHQYGQQQQYPTGSQQLFPGHQQNPETVSQLSHESPVSDSDQRSATNTQTSQSSSAVNQPPQPHTLQTQDIPGRHPGRQAQTPSSAHSHDQSQILQQQNMAPPPGPPPSRRSQEADKAGLGLGPPPSYRHSQPPNMNSPLPPPPSAGIQPPGNYRQSSLQERQAFDGQGMEGRNSPQPSASDRGDGSEDKALKELLTKYKNVKRLYFDGKKEIEQLSGQVEQLQNAIANQRMSQSRTSLDDSEYQTRFNRLNGAINNLSFNIRKDWKSLPSWLAPYITVDALKTGKQEMTAIGRAVITRWVVEEVFNRCFHPSLDPQLSMQLKQIEQNIRHNSYILNSQEEFEALTNKVVSWRMTTLEGLAQVLSSPESEANKVDFVRKTTTNLTVFLYQHLAEPAPQGVDGSAGMIIELAVGIAMNMPLESRDVAITYPLPEQQINTHIMEVEKTGLPALEPRPSDDGQDEKEGPGKKGDKSKSGMLTIFLHNLSSHSSGNPAAAVHSDSSGERGSFADHASSQAGAPTLPPKDPGKVRFAGFVAVEVRGRSVLVKAPVWNLG